MVFYRKYRPQTLDELLGQQVVKDTLFKAFQAGKLAHAYLFCGPRGVGKTSTARLLAKLVNCEKIQNAELGIQNSKSNSEFLTLNSKFPCNSCASCLSITDGSNLDLIEIDAASNRGIDDIRDLRDKVKLAPSSSQKKVYIIDEVHMLTTEAFNALLKTLEEPPAHVMFILATTEVHKIPQTILSRVQKLEFKEASVEDMLEALKNVAKAEKLEISEDALTEIAKRSDGSFRDGLKLLDQLASSGEKITVEVVELNTRSASFEVAIDILTAVSQKKTETALTKTVEIASVGTNMKEFSGSLMEILRAVLFLQNNVSVQIKNSFGLAKFEKLQVLATQFSKEAVVDVLGLLQEASEKMKYTSIPSLPLEIAIVESSLEREKVGQLGSELAKHTPNPLPKGEGIRQDTEKFHLSASPVEGSPREAGEFRGRKATDDVVGVPVDAAADELPKLMDKWTYVLETIKPYNYSLEALLRQVDVRSCVNGVVELEVPYSFHQRILESTKNRSMLEAILAEVLGKSIRITCVLGQHPIRVEEIANVEIAADDEVIKIAAEIFNS